jgi:hypothetical protein
MEHFSSFNKGMSKDIDPLVFNKETYYDALNLSLVSGNETTSSLSNIKGNSLRSAIPDTTGVHRVSVNSTGATNITINGETGSGGSFTTSEDLYDYIISDAAYTNCLQNTGAAALNTNSYNIYYNETYVYFVGAFIGTTSLAQNNVTITVLNANLQLTNDYIPAQSDLYIIGSTCIRDNIYILTTADSSANPGGHDPNVAVDSSSLGQIWELLYDQVNDETTLTLLYNNYVDFTAQHPVPPTAILGRYENSNLQKIYWTDNFNRLRSFNVKNPQGFALDVTLLDTRPAINFSKPIVQNIVSGGNLDTGTYETIYRLKNISGASSKFSPPSNIINIVSSSEATATGGGNFNTYFGNSIGTNTGKAIIWKFQDLDTDYERIEVVSIFRDILGNTPTTINIIADEPIPSNGEILITHTGNEDLIPLTLDEIIAIDDSFTVCKTIATKDNRLFVANIKQRQENLDYDARAFRAKTSGADDIYLTNNGTQSLYSSATAQALDETEDAINDYTNANAGYYKPNTAILGGAGANISYEFGTVAVRADSTIELLASMTGSPFRHTNPEYNISDYNLLVKRIDNTTNQLHPTNTINDDIKYPFPASVFKGYERGEIYRFAITFYDKSGNPYYTKWIGDIKMPTHGDTCPTGNAFYEDGTLVPVGAYTGGVVKDFRSSFVDNKGGTDECFVNQIFVKFDVSIPVDISEQVSGYIISRVPREQSDKTVLGTGILNQVVSDGGRLFLPDYQETSEGAGSAFPYLNIDINTRASTLNASDSTPTFECPEFLLGSYPGFATGDKIRIVSRVTVTNTVTDVQLDGAGEPYIIYKYYDIDNTGYVPVTDDFTLEEAGFCDRNSTYSFSGATNVTWSFNNYTNTDTTGGGSEGSDAVGSKTLCLGLDSNIEFNTTYGCTEANGKKLLAQYIRPVASQYGGNTYNQRSNNEYIACSHFRPIDNYLTATTDSSQIFGGDVYCQIYDNQKEIKNWFNEGLGAYVGGDGGTPGGNASKVSITQFFPCLASQNTDLRHGNHINKDLDVDDGSTSSGAEEYDYNSVYSNIQDIKRFFPQPNQTTDLYEYDNRVWASEIKINGELVDSWGIFLVDNKWDVEGSYGPINALEVMRDKMFFWQDNAFGILSINPRSLITDQNGAALQLGTGDVIQRHDYISTENGSKHQWSILKSPNSLLWWDANVRKMMRFSNGLEQLSDVKGLSTYLYDNTGSYLQVRDNPIFDESLPSQGIGIHGVYDFKNNEFIITFNNIISITQDGVSIDVPNNFTLAFNEEVDAFTSFYSFTPVHYITNHREIYSPDANKGASLYLHEMGNYCTFYDTIYESKVTPIINPNPQYTKVFDNLEWITNSINSNDVNITSDTWNEIRIRNTYQNTDFQPLTPDITVKRKERGFKYAIPRNRVLYTTVNANIYNDLSLTEKDYGERIRDKYIYVDFIYHNTDNYSFTFKLLNTIFRPSAR